jgi:hypothetical protein
MTTLPMAQNNGCSAEAPRHLRQPSWSHDHRRRLHRQQGSSGPSPPRTGRGCRVAEPFTELPAWLTDIPDHAVLLIYRAFLDCLNPR